MKKAAESAAKWLADKVMGNPKLNPVPYALFRSIVNKQIEWAAKRGVRFDFTELSEAVRSELLKAGIYTMSSDGKQEHKTASLFDANSGGEIPSLILRLGDDDPKMPALF